MATLSVITINGRQIVVETDAADLPVSMPDGPAVPRGAEATGFADRLKDAATLIEDTVGSIANTVLNALQHIKPDECSVEIGLSFKGEHQPIPVLVKVGGDASIKVTATWKKPSG